MRNSLAGQAALGIEGFAERERRVSEHLPVRHPRVPEFQTELCRKCHRHHAEGVNWWDLKSHRQLLV